MSEVIKVNEVTKSYNLYNKPIDRLKESMSFIRRKSYHVDFKALNSISFSVNKGECFGIIGTNGSGKSTILKIITGVLQPTTGSVEVNGRVSALLELGAGFNMDYTGIENIYMNGMVLGMSKSEVDKILPKIEEFAEIGDFINQPVKLYSSGMFASILLFEILVMTPFSYSGSSNASALREKTVSITAHRIQAVNRAKCFLKGIAFFITYLQGCCMYSRTTVHECFACFVCLSAQLHRYSS